MNQQLTVQEGGQRLDSFVAQQLPQYSRSFWQRAIAEGQVTVHGAVVRSSQALTAGDIVTIQLPESPDFTAQTLPILYEDADVLVINKPAGLLTHAKGATSHEFSVGEFMRSRTTDGTDTNRPGIVHRLDRGTSGVLIAAKTPEAKRWLQKQFSLRKVKKTYVALVTGHPKQPSAVIQLPIERNPKKPQTFRVGGNGKPAETAYQTLKTYTSHSLLQLMPHTGRTHQLRVHLRYIGCPIVGDELYGKPAPHLGRMFLHAAKLEITLPSRERRIFEAPLPDNLEKYLKSLS